MKTPCIELVYFPGCPNVEAARGALRAALTAEGLESAWREWNRDDPATPAELRGYGSPTVLIDGRDIAATDNDALCCRVYETAEGLRGAPDVTTLRAALRTASNSKGVVR